MIPFIVGVTAYLVAGILTMTYSRCKFLFSLLGWFGAVAGLVSGILLYQNQGALVTNLGKWGILGIEIKLDQTTLLFAALIVLLNFFTNNS